MGEGSSLQLRWPQDSSGGSRGREDAFSAGGLCKDSRPRSAAGALGAGSGAGESLRSELRKLKNGTNQLEPEARKHSRELGRGEQGSGKRGRVQAEEPPVNNVAQRDCWSTIAWADRGFSYFSA